MENLTLIYNNENRVKSTKINLEFLDIIKSANQKSGLEEAKIIKTDAKWNKEKWFSLKLYQILKKTTKY